MAERILVVDDDLSLRQVLTILLERAGYEVRSVGSGEQAKRLFERGKTYELVLTDLNMPGIDGLELLTQIKTGETALATDTPVIMITAFGSADSAVRAMKLGAEDYVMKPFDNDELLILVRKALGRKALVQENTQLREALTERYGFHNLIGRSPPMRDLYTMIKRIKDSRISCLIQGESGTGKELVARALHFSGARASQPFVAVNCGAIPENLIESELFGHKKGAFTGAIRDKVGYFAAADKGTLFLDEVGEMPLHAQVKLLRVLQEKKVTAVGGTSEESVDVRIIAATNRDLQAEVESGGFREDLYYRLNVVKLSLPALRERTGDIELLARHFVAEFAKEYGVPVRGLSDQAVDVLTGYSWPGNVRELRNALEGAVALETEGQITERSLPHRITGVQPVETAQAAPLVESATHAWSDDGIDLDQVLAEVERTYLARALASADGNKTRAAKLLGMSFRSFRYRLAKHHDLDS